MLQISALGNHTLGYQGMLRFECEHSHETTTEARTCAIQEWLGTDLPRELAEALDAVAPVKIEGGSPARGQWLADVLQVLTVLLDYGLSAEYVAAFAGEDVAAVLTL